MSSGCGSTRTDSRRRLLVSTVRLFGDGSSRGFGYYNVVPGKEDAHYKFVKEECVPGMEELGVPVTQGWRLVIGSGPRMLAECTARNLEDIAKAIDTSMFRKLVRKLKKELARDYSSRILAPTGRIEVPSLLGQMLKGF